MNKLVFLIMLIYLAIASSFSTNAQVDWEVYVSWDYSQCGCNDPVTIYARGVIRTYPEGEFVDDSDWIEITANPATVYGNAPSLQDCQEDCYNIAIEIKVEDNTGQCCYGAENENVTGQELKNGYSFETEIILH
jgi:hypothetical protein